MRLRTFSRQPIDPQWFISKCFICNTYRPSFPPPKHTLKLGGGGTQIPNCWPRRVVSCHEPTPRDCQRTLHCALGRVRNTCPQRSRRAAHSRRVTQRPALSRLRRYRFGNCTLVSSRRQGNRQAWLSTHSAADVPISDLPVCGWPTIAVLANGWVTMHERRRRERSALPFRFICGG